MTETDDLANIIPSYLRLVFFICAICG